MISININNTTKQVSKETSLEQLLNNLQHTKNGIAVAINNSIISKTVWSETLLKENDSILIIKATQGG